MTLLRQLVARARRSRIAPVVSAAALGLLLALGAPSVLAALGSLSAPVGCHSAVVGDHSDPCILVPVDNDSGGDDSGVDAGGVADDVVSATPTFTG